MLRQLVRLVVAAILATGLVAIAPTPTVTAAQAENLGKAKSSDKVLRRGCRMYTYKYKVKPPTSEWSAEIFIRGPRGKGLHTGVVDSEIDPKKGKKRYQLCHHSTRPGKHKIKMLVTWNDMFRGVNEGWAKPTSFRMKRPR